MLVLWGEKGDIALPSATQNELNGDEAKQLVANGVIAVSEGENMPSTPEAIRAYSQANPVCPGGEPMRGRDHLYLDWK